MNPSEPANAPTTSLGSDNTKQTNDHSEINKNWNQCSPSNATQGVCPVCTGRTLIEIRGKLQCQRCHAICETCCEGGRI